MINKDKIKYLRDRFSPIGSELYNAQIRMLDMLIWFDKIMKINHIPYFLDSGTLLGAIRHKGFIPWDDDLDIIYPAKYTEKIKEVFSKIDHPNYILQTNDNDPYCFKMWLVLRDKNSEYLHERKTLKKIESVKVYRGLQIDLFPISNNTNEVLNKFLFSPKHNLGNIFISIFGTSYVSKHIARILFMSQKKIADLLLKFYPQQEYWTYAFGTGYKAQYSYDELFPFIEVEFENHYFPAPHLPDKVLTRLYGNFMNLPSENELNHHKISKIKIW